MAQFYGSITKSAKNFIPAVIGYKNHGLAVRAASWQGAIEVELYWDKDLGKDCFIVRQTKHRGEGVHETMITGIVGEPTND